MAAAIKGEAPKSFSHAYEIVGRKQDIKPGTTIDLEKMFENYNPHLYSMEKLEAVEAVREWYINHNFDPTPGKSKYETYLCNKVQQYRLCYKSFSALNVAKSFFLKKNQSK